MTADAGATVAPTKPPLLAYDFVRLGVAVVVGLFATGVLSAVLVSAGMGVDQVVVAAILGFSAVSSTFYVVHTLLVFRRPDGPTLFAWLKATQPDGRFGSLGAMLAGTGPTIAVQWSVAATAAVLCFTIFPILREPITGILAILVVASSWAVTVVAYAVHYARIDAAFGGFQYPDDQPRLFGDFVYLSVQVQTTFSTSDVSLVSPRARAIVTGHTLVSFAFNTVIIAMLITVLFLGR